MKKEKWRAEKDSKYFTIKVTYHGVEVLMTIDFHGSEDNLMYEIGNYFATKEEAEAVAEKIRKVLMGADICDSTSQQKIKFWDELKNINSDIDDLYRVKEKYNELIRNPKIKAVLAGTDVIQMPCEEEILKKSEQLLSDYYDAPAELCAESLKEWLKTKIIK